MAKLPMRREADITRKRRSRQTRAVTVTQRSQQTSPQPAQDSSALPPHLQDPHHCHHLLAPSMSFHLHRAPGQCESRTLDLHLEISRMTTTPRRFRQNMGSCSETVCLHARAKLTGGRFHGVLRRHSHLRRRIQRGLLSMLILMMHKSPWHRLLRCQVCHRYFFVNPSCSMFAFFFISHLVFFAVPYIVMLAVTDTWSH